MGRPGSLGLLLLLLAGCATERATPGALVERLRGHGYVPPDAVQVEVALIERRVGDSTVDRDLWTFTDEQAVDLVQKAVLEDNGVRVGLVVGMTPSGLQDLLTSQRACSGRHYLLGPGKAASIELGTAVPHCQFKVLRQGDPVEISLDEAQFVVRVLPSLTADGRTRLHFTPQVKFGENQRDFRVAEDGSGMYLQINRPAKTFEAVSWDVTVGPNQWVLIGGRSEAGGRLGQAFFVHADGAAPVQWLLAIRTNRAAAGSGEELTPQAQVSPLALQATQ
jgi:hypothetical protein